MTIGSFAMWAGCFASCECTLIYLRQRDDPLNAIAGGVFTGGLLAIRGGLNIALKNAIFGGLILAIIEGVGVIFTAVQAQNRTAQLAEQQKAQMEMYRQMGMNIGGPPPVAKSGDEAGSFMNDKYAQLSNLAPEAREQSYQF